MVKNTLRTSERNPEATRTEGFWRRFPLPFGWRMVLPAIVALIAVVGFPLGYALYIAFHEYDLTEGGIGAVSGLDNFRRVLDMEVFVQAVRNTVVLTVSVVVLELIIAFGLALLLNQPGLRFRHLYLLFTGFAIAAFIA